MRMSAVSNPFNYFSDTPVAVPLVLGASTRTFRVLSVGSFVGKNVAKKLAKQSLIDGSQVLIGKKLAKQLGKVVDGEMNERILKVMGKDLAGDTSTNAARKKLGKEMTENILTESGEDIVTRELAEEMAEAAISKKVKREALEKGAAKWAVRGAIAGVGYGVFSFGVGFIPTLGSLLGEAGANAANDVVQWMGDNPLVATAGIGIGILFIGGLILTAVAPTVAAKKAKDKVTQGDEA